MERDVKALAALLAAAGVAHVVKPEPFEQMVPRALPRRRELVHASGVVEVACAAMLLHPRTRRAGGLAAAGLLVGVFPANLQMTADVLRSRRASPVLKAGVVGRLPLQVPLVRTALKASRGAR
ncbi:MAG: DoxX family protein [Propionibacteriales bacterium]|nr:DoxX family protein [Propionibacteriales bacterium]